MEWRQAAGVKKQEKKIRETNDKKENRENGYQKGEKAETLVGAICSYCLNLFFLLTMSY